MVEKLIAVEYCDAAIKEAGSEWLAGMHDAKVSKEAGEKLKAACGRGLDMTGTEWEADWIAKGKPE